jgi:Ca2+-binding EF-hand superfamily protein
MDTNGDGVITRQEWRGNAQSFARLDVNRDGVLSGTEVWTNDDDWRQRGERDGVLAQTFRRADANRDGIISRKEWTSDSETFKRVDVNGDGVLTEPEFLGEGWGPEIADQSLTEEEAALAERFRRADANRNDVISRGEWDGAEATFNRLDVNRDGVLTRREFLGERAGVAATGGPADNARRDSKVYQSGYDRGLTDGRQAGREDRELRNQWDLEGQRELEQADAGYTAALGARADYQAGYRAGFRAGYKQGFGPRT